jgi:hypothetical protein
MKDIITINIYPPHMWQEQVTNQVAVVVIDNHERVYVIENYDDISTILKKIT